MDMNMPKGVSLFLTIFIVFLVFLFYLGYLIEKQSKRYCKHIDTLARNNYVSTSQMEMTAFNRYRKKCSKTLYKKKHFSKILKEN